MDFEEINSVNIENIDDQENEVSAPNDITENSGNLITKIGKLTNCCNKKTTFCVGHLINFNDLYSRVHFMRKPRRSYTGALTKSHARTVKCLYSHKKLNNVTPIRYTYVKHTQVVISLLRTCSNYLIAITLLSTTLSDFATLLSISTNFNTLV